MLKINVYNIKGEQVGTEELNESVFGAEYKESLIHDMVVAFNANNRQGTKSTLTRSEVRGHAKKPWKQKHTGRARQGSTKGPQWRGGGVVFAPKPRDFSKKVNKSAKISAFKSAISAKFNQNEILCIDNFDLQEVKTKNVANFLDTFKLDKKVVIVIDKANKELFLSSRNIPNVSVVTSDLLNVYELVANRNVVILQPALKLIEEAYKD